MVDSRARDNFFFPISQKAGPNRYNDHESFSAKKKLNVLPLILNMDDSNIDELMRFIQIIQPIRIID